MNLLHFKKFLVVKEVYVTNQSNYNIVSSICYWFAFIIYKKKRGDKFLLNLYYYSF